MIAGLILMAQFAASEELAGRLAVLQKHVERLAAISVPADLEAQKQERLSELRKAVESGVNSVEQFNELYFKIDAVRMWLWDHSAQRPRRVEGTHGDSTDAWALTNPHIELSIAKADLSITVRTKSAQWQFEPCNEDDVELKGKSLSFLSAQKREAEPFDTGYSKGMILSLTEFPDAPELQLSLCINLVGNEVVFEVVAPSEAATELEAIYWPKPVTMGNAADDFSVIPLMQGMLVPGNWPQEIHHKDLCNSRSLYMPWWGQIHDGHGVQTILETSDDAGAAYDHKPGGPTRIQPRWYASLGKLRYARSVRYVFDDAATYVAMAKRYRRYVQETGRFVSLREKLARTPNLKEVVGRPVIHVGALYHFVKEASLFNKDRIEANHSLVTFDEIAAQLRDLKAKGIGDAYVHLDGWGFYGYDNGHPDVMPVGEEQGGWEGLRRFADTCDELGYLFAVHDQYRDFYFNAVSFDDRLTLTRMDGTREEHSTWCGGPQTILSPWFSPGYVRRNHDLFAEHDIKVKGAYLDVFAVVPLEESAQKAHPMTRTECAQHRRECFNLLRARGYVVSSEEPADYLIPSLDLVHHGPYFLDPNPGGGKAIGIPIPLFNLVYHDSILLPWSMGEGGGWGVPDGDAGRLHCLLNAGLPYLSPGASEEQIAHVKEALALAERCNLEEMVNHEFLDETYRRQRTTFGDGTRVTVDFDKKEQQID
ncbi:MAG: hypothetical protein HY706_09080 [Candidatus Hydrogenedentes bacterium]|nr:hypothetical protein [Candidatus Hydrogenedentota bacterium]